MAASFTKPAPARVPPLRGARLARGMTLGELARRTGIDIAHLSRVERGQMTISRSSLLRVARELDWPEMVRLLEPWEPDERR